MKNDLHSSLGNALVAFGTSVEDRRDHTSLLARCRNSGIC